MDKTLKQIADELKIDKQKVYRYVKKNHIKEAYQKQSVMYYDDTVQELIKTAFVEKECINEAHQEAHQNHINDTVNEALLKQIEVLQNQLTEKDKQISKLHEIIDHEQQLNARNQQMIEDLKNKKSELLLELEQQKEQAHEAHEEQKEQKEPTEQSKGFWNRIYDTYCRINYKNDRS